LEFRAKARIDTRTKNLIKRLHPGEIAVIDHADLDQVAADSLVTAKVRLVINASPSMTGRYPNPGPRLLLEAGIPILDRVGRPTFDAIIEGDLLEIHDNQIWHNGVMLGEGRLLRLAEIQRKLREIRKNLAVELDRFLHNTMEYASKEKELILGNLKLPEIRTRFEGRPVLVVVRGQNYREDLTVIKSYIRDNHPVLIGVDGGADALLEFGYRPDIIIGDMDSVSDPVLNSGAEIIVHAYPDGRAPGMARIQELGLAAETFPSYGTSEDIALLLAYEKGADLIVAVGTHSSMVDFLEKGRAGMGSTFLVRLKVGSILVDARGVSRIYRSRLKMRYLAWIIITGVVVALIAAFQAPWSREFLRALWLQIRVLFGL
jgi:uncharacterized membrane-anchored protein